jgi:hypothetical protein
MPDMPPMGGRYQTLRPVVIAYGLLASSAEGAGRAE